jgi:hypothetical protein
VSAKPWARSDSSTGYKQLATLTGGANNVIPVLDRSGTRTQNQGLIYKYNDQALFEMSAIFSNRMKVCYDHPVNYVGFLEEDWV